MNYTMRHGKVDGLMVVRARDQYSVIETEFPTREVAEAVMAGTIVIVKNAFAAQDMRRVRASVHAAQIPVCEQSLATDAKSWRDRREVWMDPDVDVLWEGSFLAVTNPDDDIGRTMRAPAERLATFWRALTGCDNTFVAKPDRRALRPWAMYYPAGGGCFGWHAHSLEPTRIGIILALSEFGVDFRAGGTEFRTPHGLIAAEAIHDIGDICLFRYDLQHRVTVVDPDQKLLWDGCGRWTLLIQGDPRPAANAGSAAVANTGA